MCMRIRLALGFFLGVLVGVGGLQLLSFKLGDVNTAQQSVAGQSFNKLSLNDSLMALGDKRKYIEEHPQLQEDLLRYLELEEQKSEAAVQLNLDRHPLFHRRLAVARQHILAGLYEDEMAREELNDSSLLAYFNDNRELFVRKQVCVAQIILHRVDEAHAILEQLKKSPEEFERLSKRHSHQQGDSLAVAWYYKGGNLFEFDQLAFNTPKGSVAASVLKSSVGYHLIKVLDVRYHRRREFKFLKESVKVMKKRKIARMLLKEPESSSTQA